MASGKVGGRGKENGIQNRRKSPRDRIEAPESCGRCSVRVGSSPSPQLLSLFPLVFVSTHPCTQTNQYGHSKLSCFHIFTAVFIHLFIDM